ncbi:transposase, partial [Halobacillus seohaensis]
MIERQLSMNLSAYTGLYDAVIPKDHLLREINDLIDFSFIYDELKDKYCHDNGRNAIHPIRMFKYLLLKTIYTLSDVDLVERTRVDMSFKYFLEMAPEDDVIDPSLLTHFRRKRLESETFLDLLIEKTIKIAIEKNIIQSSSIILDATHSKARYNQWTPQEILRQRSKNVRKVIYSIDESVKEEFPEKPKNDTIEEEIEYTKQLVDIIEQKPTLQAYPKVKEPFNLLKETVDDHQEFLPQSTDPDA